MLIAALTVAVLSAQDPGPAPSGGGTDVVVLRSGEELHGTVQLQTADYVEIRLAPDTVVGMGRAQIAEVRRGVAPAPVATPSPADGAAAPAGADAVALPVFGRREQWFVLHDGSGRAIGTLHALVQPADDGTDQVRLSEEWSFAGERSRTEVTRLEVVDGELRPVSSFYHERVRRDGDDANLAERLVRADVHDGVLVVVRTDLRGSERREYPLHGAVMLPLALDELMRQNPAALGHQGTRVVYDSVREELTERRFSGGMRRRVEIDGKVVDVREVIRATGSVRNAEWLDAACKPVRRELNGPALVAVAMPNKAVAVSAVASNAALFPPGMAREAEGRFALWLPNPSWQVDEGQQPGQVTASARLYDASVAVMALDHLGGGSSLQAAADATERWLRLATDSFRLRERSPCAVRGHLPALRLCGTYLRSDGDWRRRYEVEVVVMPRPDATPLAVCFSAPAPAFDDLREGDFTRMLEGIELHPKLLAADAAPKVRPPKD